MITDMTLEEAMNLQKWRPGVHYVSQAEVRMELMKAEIERLRASSAEAVYIAERRGIEAALNHFYPTVGFDRGPIRAAIRAKLGSLAARPEASEGAETSPMDYEKAVLDEISKRDHAEETIEKLLELIGVEYEWSSSFGFDDAVDVAGEVLLKMETTIRDMEAEIGVLPPGAHPDERKPRAATWLAERANWENEVAQLRAQLAAPAPEQGEGLPWAEEWKALQEIRSLVGWHHEHNLPECTACKVIEIIDAIPAHRALLARKPEAQEQGERALREALKKVRAHTGLPPRPTIDLLLGLIASIERITDDALLSRQSAEEPTCRTCGWVNAAEHECGCPWGGSCLDHSEWMGREEQEPGIGFAPEPAERKPEAEDTVYASPCGDCGNVHRHNQGCVVMRERRAEVEARVKEGQAMPCEEAPDGQC